MSEVLFSRLTDLKKIVLLCDGPDAVKPRLILLFSVQVHRFFKTLPGKGVGFLYTFGLARL